jgi:hypothetical protein
MTTVRQIEAPEKAATPATTLPSPTMETPAEIDAESPPVTAHAMND